METAPPPDTLQVMHQILVPLAAALVGACGWILLEFCGRPVRQFFELRREIRTEMLRFAHVSAPNPAARFLPSWSGDDFDFDATLDEARTASELFRQMGARMMAFGETEWLAAKIVRAFGFEPVVAGYTLIKLSADLITYGSDRAPHRAALAKALRFKF
jgi:hypothetical protein